MKLEDITFKDSKEFEFLDPVTKKGFEPKVTVEILNSDSKEAKNNFMKAQRKVFELTQEPDNLDDDKKLKPELLEEINNVYLSSLIVSWQNIEDFKKVTDEAKLELMKNEHISKFVLDKSGNLGNFRGE